VTAAVIFLQQEGRQGAGAPREPDEFYQLLTEHAADLLSLNDADGRAIWASRSPERRLARLHSSRRTGPRRGDVAAACAFISSPRGRPGAGSEPQKMLVVNEIPDPDPLEPHLRLHRASR